MFACFFQTPVVKWKIFKLKRRTQIKNRDLAPDTFLFVQNLSPVLPLFKINKHLSLKHKKSVL